jgi:hypothetical protein
LSTCHFNLGITNEVTTEASKNIAVNNEDKVLVKPEAKDVDLGLGGIVSLAGRATACGA